MSAAAPRQLTHPSPAPRRSTNGPYGAVTPGAYTAVQACGSREHWRSELFSDLHHPDVDELRRHVAHRGPVSVRACYATAWAISAAADSATGRNAMPGNTALTTKAEAIYTTDPASIARLATATGYSTTTVQKAVAVLTARGWLRLIRAGKNWLTRTERRELHSAGSRARRRRNVWACTLPRHVRIPSRSHPTNTPPVDNRAQSQATAPTGCDLPTTRRVSRESFLTLIKIFTPEQASRTGPTGRQQHVKGPQKRTYRADPRVVRLAKDLQARIYWLRDVPHQRITTSLHRFAIAGWTAAEVHQALDDLLAARRWRVPDGRTTPTGRTYPLTSPWGYLAALLRGLDPADRAIEAAYAAEQAHTAYQQALISGTPCPHGQPGGALPSPTRGIQACPLCRLQAPLRPSVKDSNTSGNTT